MPKSSSPKILPTDEKMLVLMDYAVRSGIVDTEMSYCEQIGYARTNLSNVRKGLQSFRIEHVRQACILTGACADWILGLEKQMFRKPGKTTLQALKQAVAAVEFDLKSVKKR